MGRNKKDAAQDVLTLYNQMQEDESIESGKKEIHATLNEIESSKGSPFFSNKRTYRSQSYNEINKNRSYGCPKEYGKYR